MSAVHLMDVAARIALEHAADTAVATGRMASSIRYLDGCRIAWSWKSFPELMWCRSLTIRRKFPQSLTA